MINQLAYKLLVLMSIFVTFSACEKDEDVLLIGKQIENTELQGVLVTMGYEFDDTNKLIMNDKATSTKVLDLSNKGLTDLKGLDIFPSLEDVNLANNNFKEFDFELIPASITKINLQDNELYEFKNLDKARKFVQLYLPETAKYNMKEVLDYYKANENADIQIKIDGKMEKYSYLRTVPDALLRKDLQKKFPSVFTGDKIDLSKDMAVLEAGNGLLLAQSAYYGDYDQDIKNLEGIQYIIGVNNFSGSIVIRIPDNKTVNLDYFKVPETTNSIILNNINLDRNIDWSNAKSLEAVFIKNCEGLETIDFSISEIFLKNGNQGFPGHGMRLNNCPDLEKILMPNRKDEKDVSIACISLKSLPKLKKFNFSEVRAFNPQVETEFINIDNCKITYPVKLDDTNDENIKPMNLTIDKVVKAKAETIEFISNFRSQINLSIAENDAEGMSLKSGFENPAITDIYTGVITPVMNGKTYNNVNHTFKLKKTGTNKMDIDMPKFKVGSMPGNLLIDIDNTEFTRKANGDISFSGSQKKCVKLDFMWGLKFTGDYHGTIKGNDIEFFIHSEGKILFWNMFKADVTFKGTKQ